ncbi:hypothetical protein [Mycobacteroides chelonae]|uniref:hypothetical protein n=1 Tax=Mycobacteroides chelonae TaxID=1774 RepID=UPI0018B0DB25|nr:hypothetical protein [Mycobacteroides chelonae]MBF9328242.1 hypothetical protein [Mycobacteroides chelonae]MBF9422420.1 hypothetical protein [Mycobacteroides chelonae]
MSMLSRLRDLTAANPEPTPEPEPEPAIETMPSSAGCRCRPESFDRGPKFGGTVLARGRGVPTDNGLRVL